jgi:hypothetical protein
MVMVIICINIVNIINKRSNKVTVEMQSIGEGEQRFDLELLRDDVFVALGTLCTEIEPKFGDHCKAGLGGVESICR